jgi:hypothetical protein
MDATDSCPDCGSRLCICGFRRSAEMNRQMQERSCPLYELSRERSSAAYEAWQKAGRPPRITTIWVPVRSPDSNIPRESDGEPVYEKRLVLAAAWKRGELVNATPEQIAARAAYYRASRPPS